MRTYGYDYSFAVSVEEVNKILSNNLDGVNLELKYNGKDPESGSTINLAAKMAPWQIIKGGQNSHLRFSMPLNSGLLAIAGPITKNYNLTNVTILIEVTLGWVGPGGLQQASGSGNVTELVFVPTMATDPTNPGYVVVVNIIDPEKRLDTIGAGLLRKYTANILFENKDKINYIFANVFPKPAKVSSWLTPYKWIYYYSTGKSYDALCFLCMLSDKQWPSTPSFDSSSLTAGNNSTILIAQEVFFGRVVLPSVTSAFSGGNFLLGVGADESCSITNKGDFNVPIAKGTITASTFKLTTSNSGNGLKTYTSGGGPLKFFFGLGNLPNASFSWSCQNTNALQYADNKVTFLKDMQPITTHDQDIPWYDWILLVVLGITSLPGLISVIVDSVNDFSDTVNDVGINNINSNLGNAVSGSIVNFANLINWSTKDGQNFKVGRAGLDGVLYVKGNLN